MVWIFPIHTQQTHCGHSMLKLVIAILVVFFCFFSFTASAEETSDVDYNIDIGAAYVVQDNFLRSGILRRLHDTHLTKNRSYGLIDILPSLSVRANEWVQGYFGVSVTWENPEDEWQDDPLESEVTSAYLSLKSNRIRADIGIQPVEFANGFILADNVLAAVINGSHGNGYAEVKAAHVLDGSPMAGVTLGYRPGYFERLELFGIWLNDREGILADSLPFTRLDTRLDTLQALIDLKSEGNIYYIGGAADLFVGDTMLTIVGAYQTGEYTIEYLANGRAEVSVNAYFGDIGLAKNLGDNFSVELFCHLASGDNTFRDRDLEAFFAATPYNPRAAIFFSPEFMDNDDADRFSFTGGGFGGAVAPGINLTLISEWGLTAEAALIYLYAHQSLEDGSQWYGWEADLSLSYAFAKKYRLYVEAARFEHGDYFESLLDEQIDPAVRFVAGIDASF